VSPWTGQRYGVPAPWDDVANHLDLPCPGVRETAPRWFAASIPGAPDAPAASRKRASWQRHWRHGYGDDPLPGL
jgi:hypothetical protein